MATPYRIHITPTNTGLWNIRQSEEAAQTVSETLQKDLRNHHVFLNNVGCRTICWLSMEQAQVSLTSKGHTTYVILFNAQSSPSTKPPYLGKEEYYPDFLAYFQRAIEREGYESVKSHLLKGDGSGNDLLLRLHAGIVHPLIQLMYGLEWEQPAIVAQALAQTCVYNIEGLD
ncbi:hypothetical protein CEP53_008880 [Fusarium sp. AF-6]|nr:hypothetical protein CEP53_008880 [Fusarium sp. AF-6]